MPHMPEPTDPLAANWSGAGQRHSAHTDTASERRLTVAAQQALIETLQGRLTMSEARRERAEALVHGFEGTLRNIRNRAQTGQVATSPVFVAELFETIDALAALALMHGPAQVNTDERTHDEW